MAREWTESELERKEKVLAGQSVVANRSIDIELIDWARKKGKLVSVMRNRFRPDAIWGNKHILSKEDKDNDEKRNEVCDLHEIDILKDKELLKKIPNLKGKVLNCDCHPKRCHGDTLARLANEC